MGIEFYIKHAKNYSPLSLEEEKELFKKAKNGDAKAKDTLILSNIKFVISVAKEYYGLGIPLDDLISEGIYGLLKAYEKFDYTKGFKFITYAVWWIKQSILKFISNEGKLIRIPQNKLNSINKIIRLKLNLEIKEGKELPLDEIEKFLDNPTIVNDYKYNNQIINIDEPLTEDEDNLNNVIPDENFLKILEKQFIKEELYNILNNFSEREKEIILLYFGIDQPRPYTLTEISYGIGLTKERIRQIKESTLDKIKSNDELKNKLKD